MLGGRMSKEAFGSITDLMPESFYDLLAYVVPASFFSIGLAYVSGWLPLNSPLFGASDKSIIADALIGFIIFGAMYFIGQVATSSSFYIVAVPIRWVLAKRNASLWKADNRIVERWFAIRGVGKANEVAEVSKRLARWVMSRNVVFFSTILGILCLARGNTQILFVCSVCFIIGLIDFTIRTSWLQRSFESVLEDENPDIEQFDS